jgi:16S rRNA processing protein RimM
MAAIAIGRVRTSFGLDGSVKVESFSGETAHFLRLDEVEIRNGESVTRLNVERTRCAGRTPIMKFEGVDTREAARAMAGAELWVEREFAAELSENEFYTADLVGLTVRFDGADIGTIASVLDGTNGELLEIELEGKKVLVPFLDRFVGQVNIEDGYLELRVRWIVE